MAQWSWLDFFTEAGVPEGHCESYADVFEDNRITEDMLSELDREILQAMGVAVMGDGVLSASQLLPVLKRLSISSSISLMCTGRFAPQSCLCINVPRHFCGATGKVALS